MAEFDSVAAVSGGDPKSLAALLAAGEPRGGLWEPDELAAIFRHQMAAPLALDLAGRGTEGDLKNQPPAGPSGAPATAAAAGESGQSFAELLRQPEPALNMLEAVKNFARSNADHPESGLPHEVSAVLYYACIAAALVRLQKRISRLPDEELLRGWEWALAQAWVDEETKGLLAEALAKLK